MRLSFLGAAHEVTGSCTLLQACGKNIIIDCGMEQGADIYENCEIPINASSVDCVLLTHAHIDHSGKIPMLTAQGFSGSIYATEATERLCQIMLMDSAHIQESEALWRNKKAQRAGKPAYVPIYTTSDVTATLSQFVPCSYNKTYDIFEGIKIRFLDAGHLLGSASIEVTVTENGITKVILFSGDIGNVSRPLIRDPQKPEKADIVIIESTYGTRVHGERKDYEGQLARVIQDALDRRGNVVVPAFAVGRTQELLYLIHTIKDKGLIKNHPNFQVWIDSPMAVEATKIYYGDMMDYYDDETLGYIKKGIRFLEFPGLNLSVTSEESKNINADTEPKIIISASGMCEAGRIRHHLKHNLWRSESSVLFVGYQSAGTMGRQLIDGTRSIKLFGETIEVNAHIEQMDGISGHADKNILLSWLGNLKEAPEMVFVNHGEDSVCDEFAEEITETLGFKAEAPYNGSEYDITEQKWMAEGNKVRLERKTSAPKIKTTPVFDNLLAAGRRLMSVIERNRTTGTRELKKFTDEVLKLCTKWDRQR